MNKFEETTLLITHYNRSSSLERLLVNFNELEMYFQEIIVSDDGSNVEHLEKVKQISEKYHFRLITTPTNKGLGNNINKGQDEVKTEFTLYVQEDFVPKPLFAEKFKEALEILKSENKFDVARFYAYFKYPYLKQLKGGFSEMIFSTSPFQLGYSKFYYYSDHPHLRRKNFFEKFGRYREGIKVEATEYEMMMSFLRKKGKAIFYEDFKALFTQENSAQEPSTVRRNYWRETNNPLITLVRHAYRLAKFNIDLHFK